jgi:cytochrome bd-type quinol oxidase subunit 1
VMLGVSAWHLRRRTDPVAFRNSARLALIVLAPAALFALLVGSELGVIEGRYQPMKIAAAEAQWNTCQPCSFSLFQIGGGNNDQTPSKIIQVPHLLSLLATNSWNGQVVGMNELQTQYEQQYGSGSYVPNVIIQYWSMRVMAYLGALVLLLAIVGLLLLANGKLYSTRWFLWLAVWAIPLPFIMNTAGWLLTENGRQPWIVQGLQLTEKAASPSVTAANVVTSIIVFVVLYGALAIVDWVLMTRYARRTPVDEPPPPQPGADEAAALKFGY